MHLEGEGITPAGRCFDRGLDSTITAWRSDGSCRLASFLASMLARLDGCGSANGTSSATPLTGFSGAATGAPAKTARNRVLLDIQWDGKARGTLNRRAHGRGDDVSTRHVGRAFEGEPDRTPQALCVHFVLDGKLEDHRRLPTLHHRHWTQGSTKGDFRSRGTNKAGPVVHLLPRVRLAEVVGQPLQVLVVFLADVFRRARAFARHGMSHATLNGFV